ncbi:hypothetical protein QVD17_42101 [Tagetes erecta]|uniref:Uncharacterized protein n=1 Tax=Tagetes erecta TaxID=13708 RepID=A0AAD8JLI5_TARER|nr:hypothetical protein QVD17_42101 [Tagetes erecta]
MRPVPVKSVRDIRVVFRPVMVEVVTKVPVCALLYAYRASLSAVLEMGFVVAVKTLRVVTMAVEEFKEKIEGFGAMDHESLVS